MMKMMNLFTKPTTMSTLLCLFSLSFVSSSTLLPTTTASSTTNMLTAYDVLKSYGFPVGLLPKGVTGYELDPETGKFAAYLNGTCSFTIQGYQLRYKSTITGNISKGKLTNLKGVSVKILIIWVNIIEVSITDTDLEFSVGIASADFPIDNFDEIPQCGCGFDCKNNSEKLWNPFLLSS